MSEFKMGSRDISYESNFSNTPTTTDDKQKLANLQVLYCIYSGDLNTKHVVWLSNGSVFKWHLNTKQTYHESGIWVLRFQNWHSKVKSITLVAYNCFYLLEVLQCSPPFSTTDTFSFSPLALSKQHTPIHSEKLPAVTHVLFFHTACKFTSPWCIVAGAVSKKTIVYCYPE